MLEIPLVAPGPRPIYLQNVPIAGDAAGSPDNQPAQQSFLRKYWMYILPVVIFTFFGGSPPPEGEGANKAEPAAATPNK